MCIDWQSCHTDVILSIWWPQRPPATRCICSASAGCPLAGQVRITSLACCILYSSWSIVHFVHVIFLCMFVHAFHWPLFCYAMLTFQFSVHVLFLCLYVHAFRSPLFCYAMLTFHFSETTLCLNIVMWCKIFEDDAPRFKKLKSEVWGKVLSLRVEGVNTIQYSSNMSSVKMHSTT